MGEPRQHLRRLRPQRSGRCRRACDRRELNIGKLRVATRQAVGQWTVHQWIKKAVLLSFRLKDNAVVKAGDLGFYDKGADQIRQPTKPR